MAPLELETMDLSGDWYKFGRVMPGKNGSLSDNKADGSREVYHFECNANDESSTLSRSAGGIDIANSSTRKIISTGFELIKEIKDGDSHVLDIRRPQRESIQVRFTHRKS